MTTWRLWWALVHQTPRSLLYREHRTRLAPTFRKRRQSKWLPGISIASLSVTGVFIIVTPVLLVAILGVLIGLSLLVALLGATAIGLTVALGVSRRVHREFQRGSVETVAVTPPGLIGIHWLFAAQFVRLYPGIANMRHFVERLYLFGGVAISIMLFITLVFIGSDRWTLVTTTNGLLLVLLLGWDYRQSVVLGALCGMTGPSLSPGMGNPGLMTSGLFLSVQVLSYAGGLLMMLAIGVAVARLGESWWLVSSMVQITTFVLLRELVVLMFWRWHLVRFNADGTSLDTRRLL